MPKRFYVDKLIEDPTRPGRLIPSLAAGWVREEGDSYNLIADEQVVGADCFLIVSTKNHRAFEGKPDAIMLPDYPLDAKVNAMHQATKVAMRGRLVNRGIPADVMDNADGFRDVVEYICRVKLNNPGFSADSFDA